MKYCTQCGTPMEDYKNFCSVCGCKLDTTAINSGGAGKIPEIAGTGAAGTFKIPKAKSKPSKPLIITSIAVLIVLLLGAAGYFIGASITSVDRVVEQFEKAVISKDAKQVVKYVKSSNPDFKIDESNIKVFFDYIDSNPSYLSRFISFIDIQAQNIKNPSSGIGRTKDSSSGGMGSGENCMFTLKRDGKSLLFFDKYIFEITPYFINVSTNYKGTKILVNGQEICTADQDDFSKQIGPFVPGLYDVKAVYHTDYVDLEYEDDVDLVDPLTGEYQENVIDADMYLEGQNIIVNCNFEGAELYANGKNTGLTIKDAKHFGPVSTDGSLKLYAQMDFPWGTVKSGEVAVYDGLSVNLELSPVNDAVKAQLMETLNEFNVAYNDALNARDPSKFIDMTENLRSSETQALSDMVQNEEYHKGDITKIIYDTDSVRIYDDGSNRYGANVCDQEYYDSAFYYEGYEDTETSENVVSWEYSLIYDETSKKWLVDGADRNYSFDPVNIKEYDF